MEDSSLVRMFALLVAIAPAMIMFAYFMAMARVSFKIDKLWNAFGLGAAIAFPCILLSQTFNWLIDLGPGPYAFSLKNSLFMAAIPEELLKLGAVLLLCWEDLQEIHPRRLFMMAIACGCGFACFENILYVFELGEWQVTAIRRSISAVPGHAFVSAMMGYCIYKAVHGRNLWWAGTIILPIFSHTVYDFFLFAASNLSKVNAPAQEILWITWGFIFFVVLEGSIAHIFLYRLTEAEKASQPNLFEGDPWQGKLDHLVKSPIFWGFIGGMSIIGTGYFAHDMLDKFGTVDLVFDQGFAVFTLLHALAFLMLMLTQIKRHKKSLKGKGSNTE